MTAPSFWIVIEELESGFFGYLAAIRSAYPKVSRTIVRDLRYAHPDTLSDTWETLERVLQHYTYYPGAYPGLKWHRKSPVLWCRRGSDPRVSRCSVRGFALNRTTLILFPLPAQDRTDDGFPFQRVPLGFPPERVPVLCLYTIYTVVVYFLSPHIKSIFHSYVPNAGARSFCRESMRCPWCWQGGDKGMCGIVGIDWTTR